VGVTATKGYPVGTAGKPVVDLYEDLQCPICKSFEDKLGPTMEQMATDGKVQLVYHTLSFLDQLNTSAFPADVAKSSSRAANAAACANDQGKFLAFHDQVYKNQPAVEGTGYTDAQLEQFATAAGVPDMDTFRSCLTGGTYNGFLTQVTAEADSRQVTGTPTVFVAGKMLTLQNTFGDADKKTITDAIAAAS
jgi:protein-disulfide isomerase